MKAIYRILNLVNGKSYIGQCGALAARWSEHRKNMRNGQISPLYSDMRKYGLKNFAFIVLEEGVRNANEKEQEYIREYNSLVPNGYNTQDGGRVKTVQVGEHIEEIIDALQNSKMDMQSIAKHFGIGKDLLGAINLGRKYRQPEVQYPIRNNTIPYSVSKDKLKQIRYALKYELDKSLKDIEVEFGITKQTLYHINYGDRDVYAIPGDAYPLRGTDITKRKLSLEQQKEIVELLKDNKVSMNEIAQRYNISNSLVGFINLGKSYPQAEVSYPIRSYTQRTKDVDRRTCLTPNELKEVEHLLAETDKSIKEIAALYEVSDSSIRNINLGAIKKYYNPNLTYPLRPLVYKPRGANEKTAR